VEAGALYAVPMDDEDQDVDGKTLKGDEGSQILGYSASAAKVNAEVEAGTRCFGRRHHIIGSQSPPVLRLDLLPRIVSQAQQSANMSEKVEATTAPGGVSDIQAEHKTDHVYDASEKATYNRAGAIEAEQMEFQMGVIDTVKAYPAASWWAFVMSCTIVSLFPFVNIEPLLIIL
jgi:hypothetical protein